MTNDQTHQMVLINSHTGGAEEWICPECGRRILIEWLPDFHKIVLDEGDMDVAHSGSKGGLIMGLNEIIDLNEDREVVSAHTSENDIVLDIDEDRLDPWMRWLDTKGFKDL